MPPGTLKRGIGLGILPAQARPSVPETKIRIRVSTNLGGVDKQYLESSERMTHVLGVSWPDLVTTLPASTSPILHTYYQPGSIRCIDHGHAHRENFLLPELTSLRHRCFLGCARCV